ncbi:hypothetical protein [Aquabacterium sp.]|uniref:hypothetical protein n=1 Tax=Aquabacterium sp. TaxID=1872578 RepID=UPI00248912CC|nr:hypothetical protein [Aquabacterium sp.]MDI1258278.1 hypothetical protein [Aquabacterium sp.]
MLIRELLKGNGQGLDQRKMERAVSAELRRLKLAGEKLEGTDKKKFLMMLDTELAGAVGAALQFCALQKLMEDRDKAMAHEKGEALQRMAAGMMALGGTMGELFALGLSKLPLLSSRFGPSLVAKAEWLGLGGRVVGFIGAMVMAGWDFYHAYKENQKGNAGMAFLYGTSAIFGVGLAVAMWLGFTGFGLILLGILIVIAVAIEYFKNNKVQDWLERCLWGTAKNAERYKTLEEEMAEFKKATS